MAAQLLRQHQAILSGKHQVKNDGIRHPLFHGLAHCLAPGNRLNIEAVGTKILGQQFPQRGIVVDNENVRFFKQGHRISLALWLALHRF